MFRVQGAWFDWMRNNFGPSRRPLSSSFLWFIFRILQGNPKKELLRGLWVVIL